MSLWALILFAASCFGVSFAAAHFTERLLFSMVGRAGRAAENKQSASAGNQELASRSSQPAAVDDPEHTPLGYTPWRPSGRTRSSAPRRAFRRARAAAASKRNARSPARWARSRCACRSNLTRGRFGLA